MSTPQQIPPDLQREFELKKARRADIVIAIVIVVVGLIIIALLFILMLWERNLYNQCNTNESVYCMQFTCQQPGTLCVDNAIRYSSDDRSYACSDAPQTWIPLP